MDPRRTWLSGPCIRCKHTLHVQQGLHEGDRDGYVFLQYSSIQQG
jgi:hypothetical protein